MQSVTDKRYRLLCSIQAEQARKEKEEAIAEARKKERAKKRYEEYAIYTTSMFEACTMINDCNTFNLTSEQKKDKIRKAIAALQVALFKLP